MIAIAILLVGLLVMTIALVHALSANDVADDRSRRFTRKQRRQMGKNRADLRTALLRGRN